jgi:hypothetical protein
MRTPWVQPRCERTRNSSSTEQEIPFSASTPTRRLPEVSKHTLGSFIVEAIEATVTELRSRGVTFEDYGMPGLKSENGIVQIGTEKVAFLRTRREHPVGSRGRGERVVVLRPGVEARPPYLPSGALSFPGRPRLVEQRVSGLRCSGAAR